MAGKSRTLIDVIPYPKEVRLHPGTMSFGASTKVEPPPDPDSYEKLAVRMVRDQLGTPSRGTKAVSRVLIGSLKNRGPAFDALSREQREFLDRSKSDQAYVLVVGRSRASVVGKTPLAALYGTQTLLQLMKRDGGSILVRRLEIRDQPTVENRYLAIAMSWYAGYGRIGFDSQLWGREQWFWFVDWCLRHKVNGINICMYGYYPFEFKEYPETVFRDVEATTWLSEAGTRSTVKYTHPNVNDEFLPELIRYANARGITVMAYIGLNTFNGGYALAHPESKYRSDHPEKFRQFRYNLCPSRKDVRRYFDATIRRILEIGFNGILLEESEGSGFCECPDCRRRYYGKDGDSREALHKADAELFNRLYSVARQSRPESVIGVRMWRMGSETGVDALREGSRKIPSDTLVFWTNAMDPNRFKGWVEVFGPGRIMAQDAEALGFSALYDGLIFMFPRQYSSYVKYVDPNYRPSYPQSLANDVAQYRLAAKYRTRGVMGYAFNWHGWELATMALAQYGWNPKAMTLDRFVEFAYRYQFGEAGAVVAEAISVLPLVLETRICEGASSVPRDDPVSGGLAGLTSLQVPTRFGEGVGEMAALKADLARARKSLELLKSIPKHTFPETDRITLRYFERAAERTVCICMAGIEYRRALDAARNGAADPDVASLLSASLSWVLEDYRLVREGAFDLTEEFRERILSAIATVSRRLRRYA